jgi:hypothetical protein
MGRARVLVDDSSLRIAGDAHIESRQGSHGRHICRKGRQAAVARFRRIDNLHRSTVLRVLCTLSPHSAEGSGPVLNSQ